MKKIFFLIILFSISIFSQGIEEKKNKRYPYYFNQSQFSSIGNLMDINNNSFLTIDAFFLGVPGGGLFNLSQTGLQVQNIINHSDSVLTSISLNSDTMIVDKTIFKITGRFIQGNALDDVYSTPNRFKDSFSCDGYIVSWNFNGIVNAVAGTGQYWAGTITLNDTDDSSSTWNWRQVGSLLQPGYARNDMIIQHLDNNYANTYNVFRIKGDTHEIYFNYGGIGQKVSTANVSNPPTDAELDAAFPNAEIGITYYINDNGAGTDFYQVVYIASGVWMIFEGTAAL